MDKPQLRVAVVGSGPAGFYATGQLLADKDAAVSVDLSTGSPPRGGSSARRRARSPEDQDRHARVREDRTASGLPVPRQRRGGPRCLACAADRPLRRRPVLDRDRPRPAPWDPGRGPAGLAPGHRVRRLVQRPPRLLRHEFDLSTKRAVVVGNGNVAIDVARMLVLSNAELAVTDTADHAIEALKHRASRR